MLNQVGRLCGRSCCITYRQLFSSQALFQAYSRPVCYTTILRSELDGVLSRNYRFGSRSIGSSSCCQAKGKDKKGKQKQTVVRVNEEEMSQLMDVDKFKERLDGVLEKLQKTYVTALTVRTSVGALETLPVLFDGTSVPLNELAQVVRKSATLVVINCAPLPEAIEYVMKSLQESGMGINPQQEATTIYVQIPKVTREHRENLAKGAKTAYNTAKDKLRDLQNRQLKAIKGLDDVSEDLSHRVQAQVTAMTASYTSRADKLLKDKTTELLVDK